MITIINKIFKSYEFEYIDLDEYRKLDINNYKYKRVNETKTLSKVNLNKRYRIKKYINNLGIFIPKLSNPKIEYFIVTTLINPSIDDLKKLISDDFNNIYSYIKNSQYYNNYIDKNTSLIILLEFDDLDCISNNPILNKYIFDIEEDKYNFKKYVITYSKKQLNELYQIDKLEGSLMENINEIIYSRDNFTSFKQNPTEDSLYNLVSKLYIKLPFLKLNPKEGQISSLKGQIKMELGRKGHDKIINKILDLNTGDIKNLSEYNILSIAEELG